MKKQVVLIRGGETFDTYEQFISFLKSYEPDFGKLTAQGWKETLGTSLGTDFEVVMPKMPNSLNAKYLEWKIYFDKLVPFFNKEVVLVGNSLGSLFLAKYLSENVLPKKILGLFLVGAPYDAADSEYSLADFTIPKNLNGLSKQSQNIHFYYSSDDPIIPRPDMDKYKTALPQVQFSLLDDRGHFTQESFPELVEDIKKAFSK